jgi:isocitrate lyase
MLLTILYLGVAGKTEKKGLAQVLGEAEAKGLGGDEIDKLEAQWMGSVHLCTFDQGTNYSASLFSPFVQVVSFKAVERAINASSLTDKKSAYETYLSAVAGKSNNETREIAKDILGSDVAWDWDRTCSLCLIPFLHRPTNPSVVPRTKEGYYHFTGGLSPAIKRALAFAPYSDLLWLETKTPSLSEAKFFARKIREAFPGKWLVYNLSPSFNWAGMGFGKEELKRFVWELAEEG